jgi:hypothetical protein
LFFNQRLIYSILTFYKKMKESFMPYKVGKQTKTKGWPILEHKNGKWIVIAHSNTQEKAEASIRARHAAAGRK